ncbi:MAG: A24 family peptidase [Planctomycetota bacterium]|nr:A24 family peptidase [Planctomycetota bacterium]
MNAHWLYVLAAFGVGAAMGSFLNIVVHRLPRGLGLFASAPACPLCDHGIRGLDNVPLLSYVVRKGKCRDCRQWIPFRYPLLELLTGLLWAMAWSRLANGRFAPAASIPLAVVSFSFLSVVLTIAFIDLEHMVIPDALSLGGLVMALAVVPLLSYADGANTPWRTFFSSAFGAIVGCGTSFAVYFSGNIVFKERIKAAQEIDPEINSALGLGDVKLMAFFGAFLGWRGAIAILILASMAGAVVGCLRKWLTGDSGGIPGVKGIAERWKTGNSVVPFGPFLCLGALIYFFFGIFGKPFLG